MATSRTKALAFSAVLILVSGAFVANAAASATSALAPLRRGDDYALERPLSRHGVALGIVVGATLDSEPTRVSGATVTLTRLGDASEGPIAKTTDGEGRAVFHVARGVYRIEVSFGDLNASRPYVLSTSQRIALYFDEAGTAHWQDVRHRDLERSGEMHTLLVRVFETNGSQATPAEGATVWVFRLVDGERLPIDMKRTGPRGAAVFQLHRAAYDVEVEWQNDTASKRVGLRQDARVFFVDDGSDLYPMDATEGRASERRL